MDAHRTHGRSTAAVAEDLRYWEHVANQWRKTQPDALWRAYSDDINITLFSRWLPEQPVRLLLKTDLFDEAVGDGLIPFLASRAETVIGMDLSLTTLREARSPAAESRTACADVTQLPFADDSFDVVVSNSTLDHFHTIQELVTGIHELHRVLRPGCTLLLTIDNVVNPAVALRNALPFSVLHRLKIVPYYVGVSCGPRRLRRIVQDVGMDIVEMTAMMHCPRALAVPIARLLQCRASPRTQAVFFHWLKKFERLSCWPTRYLTGYFISLRAVKHSIDSARQ